MRLLRPSSGLALLSLLLFLLAPALAAADRDPLVLPGLDGGELREADLGRSHGTTFVVLWTTWSPSCRNIVPRLERLAAGWGDKTRLVSVVFQESPDEVRRFLAGRRLALPIYLDLDGAFVKAHAVTSLPGLLIFKDGEVVYHGALPPDPDALFRQHLG